MHYAPVKSLNTTQQLLVVSAVDQDLRVALDRLRENGQRSSVELLLLTSCQLFRRHLRLRFVPERNVSVGLGLGHLKLQIVCTGA